MTFHFFCVSHKKTCQNFLTFLENSSENILCVKIAKGYIQGDREVYLTGVYEISKHLNYTNENNCTVIDILRGQ